MANKIGIEDFFALSKEEQGAIIRQQIVQINEQQQSLPYDRGATIKAIKLVRHQPNQLTVEECLEWIARPILLFPRIAGGRGRPRKGGLREAANRAGYGKRSRRRAFYFKHVGNELALNKSIKTRNKAGEKSLTIVTAAVKWCIKNNVRPYPKKVEARMSFVNKSNEIPCRDHIARIIKKVKKTLNIA